MIHEQGGGAAAGDQAQDSGVALASQAMRKPFANQEPHLFLDGIRRLRCLLLDHIYRSRTRVDIAQPIALRALGPGPLLIDRAWPQRRLQRSAHTLPPSSVHAGLLLPQPMT